MTISFTIPGRIGGKGRAKFARRGKFTVAYTPEKTRSTEAIIRHFAAEAMRGRAMLEGPVKLSIMVRINHPASWSKKRKAATLYVTGKPDFDNVEKAVSDSLSKIVWRDDSQVAQSEFDRRYADGPEFVDVAVTELAVAA